MREYPLYLLVHCLARIYIRGFEASLLNFCFWCRLPSSFCANPFRFSFGWITMEGSSDSAWQKSDNSRGLSTSNVSDRNLRFLRGERIDFSGDAQQDFAFRKSGMMQIVEIVNVAHSQGVVIQNVRPSCFVMSSFNRVSFIESASCSDSGSDSLEDGSNSRTEAKDESSSFPRDMHQQRRSENSHSAETPTIALLGNSHIRSSSIYAAKVSLVEEIRDNKIKDGSIAEQAKENAPPFPMKQVLLMEAGWYTSPEEVAGAPSCCGVRYIPVGHPPFRVILSIQLQ
ncbi:hypothetical protein NL676_027201 [Syzygium grande]|nr:hypothetical protein NL676_027201 [Syzygium grande]